jgi:arginyl-tRNA--protein-N-Asp/Glu arginylyltransferase
MNLPLYLTPEHECSYLPERVAVTVFADPEFPKDPAVQGALTEQGFRRSGAHMYRPHCPQCNACEAVRIRVADFKPSRSQRRTWRRNSDLDITVVDQSFVREHYELYASYVSSRHAGGGMDTPTPDKYREFLLCPWTRTRLVEFRHAGQLLAVAVMDELPQALSAVYTFFQTQQAARGLGVLAILWQIESARRANLQWLYLGFAIDDCAKMGYKRDYRPQHRFLNNRWIEHSNH